MTEWLIWSRNRPSRNNENDKFRSNTDISIILNTGWHIYYECVEWICMILVLFYERFSVWPSWNWLIYGPIYASFARCWRQCGSMDFILQAKTKCSQPLCMNDRNMVFPWRTRIILKQEWLLLKCILHETLTLSEAVCIFITWTMPPVWSNWTSLKRG